MNVLAFDTCFGACSVAVRKTTPRGEVIVREEYEERTTGHAEALMPMMQRVMTGAKLEFRDLDRIAVTEGPGSFTGTRIGLATARGLALALDKPIVAITSLMAMALRADHLLSQKRAGRVLAVCADARKGQVYAQLFGENAGDVLCDAQLATPHEVLRQLRGRAFVAVGSGATAVVVAAAAEQSPDNPSSGASPAEAALPSLEPHARWLAILAPALPIRARLSPLYLRAPDAKPQSAPPPAPGS
jgi:tRNA threonylcarbamoyladenosine biosynthesis protein TsaB